MIRPPDVQPGIGLSWGLVRDGLWCLPKPWQDSNTVVGPDFARTTVGGLQKPRAEHDHRPSI
eukprot:1075519-Alexandrium_andersonii.AAC.1